MAKVTISFSPGPDGFGYANITAEGETDEVDAMTQAVDALMQHYPVLKPKPETKTAFPTRK
ncbi:MAG: hypothetical protein D4R82_05065 [Dehalococcoidia bacterium]|nr:MAG: hypothetical protein D4R82_05065 [Dehalococcoidia bacterium]